MHLINPTTTRQFISEKLEDTAGGVGGQEETAERWLHLTVCVLPDVTVWPLTVAELTYGVDCLQRSLRLSMAQRTEIIQLRRLFLSKMHGITQQRREIHQTMMVSRSRCHQPLSRFQCLCDLQA